MSSWKSWIVVGCVGSMVTACNGAVTVPDATSDVVGLPDVADVSRAESGVPDVTPVDVADASDVGVDAGIDTGAMDVPAVDVAPEGAVDVSPESAVDVGPVDAGPCGPVVDLTAAGTVTGMTTSYVGTTTGSPMTGPLTASCGAPDHEVILSYTVRATAALTVSLVNPGTALTFDTVLFVRSACTAASGGELACNDDTLPDRRSSLTTSVITAGTTVFIVVAGSTTSGSRYVDQGAFELTVTESTPGGPCNPMTMPSTCGAGYECVGMGTTGTCRSYSEASVTAPTWIDACTTGTHVVLAVSRDDGHSTVQTLPFSFTYFGTAYTQLSADTNGYLVLGPATPSDNYNAPLPLGDGPVVAPFHDDLVVNDAPTGDICTLTVGTGATAQYVVEWLGTTRFNHGAVNLNFEVVFTNTTNTIDFIYNVLSGTGADAPYADGTHASIGVEGADGTTVVLHSGTVAVGTGLRFTPIP